MVLKAGTRGRDKGEVRWAEGHYLGIKEDTGELLIGNEDGVFKVRDFKRIADVAKRWQAEDLRKLRGTPDRPNPDCDDKEVHIQVRLPHDPTPITPEFKGVEEEAMSRRLRIRPGIVTLLGLWPLQ